MIGVALKSTRESISGHRSFALMIGLTSAALFVLLTMIRIEGQGPQYDELHQATGAFTWLGSPPSMFCDVSFRGTCLLNMPYSGAIKTNLYGAFLRFVHPCFTLVSWRLFGVLFVAGGIVVFCALARSSLSRWGMMAFVALILTDMNILLMNRFDWGPVSLALVSRLAILGLWLGGESEDTPLPRWNSFWLGAITALGVFEKLSSVVVLPVLMIVLATGRPERRTRRHLMAMMVGLLVGSIPLVAVNLYTLASKGNLISLSATVTPDEKMVWKPWQYLSLGQGSEAKREFLGLETPSWMSLVEGTLVMSILLLITLGAMRSGVSRQARVAGALVLSYGVIGIGLFLLPRTWFHHWIIGAPFHYGAVALALDAHRHRGPPRFSSRAFFLILVLLTGAWFGCRLPALWTVETSLTQGKASQSWDLSLRDLGLFAASRANEAIFLASDWGVATQIYCFANGRARFVYEPYWHYHGAEQLHAIHEESGKKILYLVRLRQPPLVRAEATQRIEYDLSSELAWKEIPVEPEAASLRVVLVRKFIYVRGSR